MCRCFLESNGLYDKSRTISKVENNHFALPVSPTFLQKYHDPLVPSSDGSSFLTVKLPSPLHNCKLGVCKLSKSKTWSLLSDGEKLRKAVRDFLTSKGLVEREVKELMGNVPRSWVKHGDLLLLPAQSFSDPGWDHFGMELWKTVAASLGCSRMALSGSIVPDAYRSPSARLLLGSSGWVEHVDNGVKYVFDVTNSMFSSGNISEKLRMARLNCSGETVVDLFCGEYYIGKFCCVCGFNCSFLSNAIVYSLPPLVWLLASIL